MKLKYYAYLILTVVIAITTQNIEQISAHAQSKKESKQNFTVKIPDGLYLFQDIIDPPEFSSIVPLMIVQNGNIVDPYKFNKKQLDNIIKDNISNKSLHTFMGDEHIGQLKSIKYRFADSGEACPPVAEFEGEYKGVNLNETYMSSMSNSYGRNEYLKKICAIKTIFAPCNYEPIKKIQSYKVLEVDYENIKNEIRKHLNSVVRQVQKKERRVKFINNSPNLQEIKSLIAVDIDGNGKQDFIGICHFTVSAKNIDHDYIEYEMLFVLMDNGNFSAIELNREVFPGISMGGVLDIDHDGVFEIVYQKEMSPEKHFNESPMKQIIIIRYSKGKWETIYKTVKICGSIH